jgi:hypothetical protein
MKFLLSSSPNPSSPSFVVCFLDDSYFDRDKV